MKFEPLPKEKKIELEIRTYFMMVSGNSPHDFYQCMGGIHAFISFIDMMLHLLGEEGVRDVISRLREFITTEFETRVIRGGDEESTKLLRKHYAEMLELLLVYAGEASPTIDPNEHISRLLRNTDFAPLVGQDTA